MNHHATFNRTKPDVVYHYFTSLKKSIQKDILHSYKFSKYKDVYDIHNKGSRFYIEKYARENGVINWKEWMENYEPYIRRKEMQQTRQKV
jgi:hypothetical protein